jgi:dienelactone hydrolase
MWAKRLIGWGYATLIPDSLTPRGVDHVCDPDAQALVTPRDRVGDIGSAIAWLRAKRGIDPNRIAVLGLSHGGDAAVMATQRMYSWPGLRAAIDYYGPCVDAAEHGNIPLLVLVGGADDWGEPVERCANYGEVARPDEVFEMWT